MKLVMRYLKPRVFSRLLRVGLLLLCVAWARQGTAQLLYPFGASYFQNRYLSNPAMAGLSPQVLDLNAGYRRESSAFAGSPSNQFLTGDYGLGDRVGLGLNLYNDQAGLIRTTRVMGTYAYHVPLGSDPERLSFGISAGVQSARVDNAAVSGADQDDPSLAKFNARGTRFDVDFGVAYTDGKLTLESAFPGIATYLRRTETDVIDRTVVFSAASYLFSFNQDANKIRLEPRVDYRVVKGFDNVVDAGARISFLDDLLDVFGMYHTSRNASFGAGVHIQRKLSLVAIYTTPVPAMGSYGAGSFGVSVAVKLGKIGKAGNAVAQDGKEMHP